MDAKTGGPAELQIEGKFYLLWGMPKDEAENWSLLLNQIVARRGHQP
ncbi:MAG TPA: hypothetical protein VGN93_01630 [Shinella sp.]|nr:hypothetical protein [Shinella sp.]